MFKRTRTTSVKFKYIATEHCISIAFIYMNSATSECFVNNNQNCHKNSVNGLKYTMEKDFLSQDLHFKMSKKIAQLTKVL